jgi:hypothetical protein
MKTKLIALLGLAGLALFGLVSSAVADTLTLEVTFTGTVVSSMDPFGVFGCTESCTAADNPYKGYSYTATYLFDDLAADSFVTFATPGDPSSGVNNIGLEGGTFEAPLIVSPLSSDSATITDGAITKTFSVDPNGNAGLGIFTSGGVAFTSSGALPYTFEAFVVDGVGNSIRNTITSSSLPFSLTENFGPFSVTGGNGLGQIQFSCDVDGAGCKGSIDADLTVSLKVLSTGATVPEPSTWVMMLIGFASLGYAGYRDVKSVRAAPAA